MTSDAAAIDTRDLRKEYGAGRVAVKGLTLRVEPGEVFGFLGANGAGKTTALKMLLGLVRPTSGWATIFGVPITHPASRRVVGYQPEQFRFPEWMSGAEVLGLHGRLAGMSGADLHGAVPAALQRVGLAGRGGDRVRTYSKGMQQRLALAQAMVARPRLVLLDEPTSALDPVGRIEVRDVIHSLAREGVTVFLNSHLLSEVEMVCDRVAILHQGEIVRSGRLQELLQVTTRLHVTVDRVTPGLVEQLQPFSKTLQPNGRSIDLELIDPSQVPAIARAVHAAGAELWELRPHQASLEDVFIGIVRPE